MWNYSFWKGTLYPEGSKTTDHLKYYSGMFNTVEVNSTYYDTLPEARIERWKGMVNTGFKFCPKFPKEIRHDNELSNIELLTNNFIESIKGFGENLGICFLQLPPWMNQSDIHLIDDLLTFINNRINISIEIRLNWLSKANILNECLSVLKKHKAGIVMVDSAETIKYLNDLKLTNSTAFIRFLSYNHPTDFERINDWINLIKFWQQKGLKEIYFMLHFADGEKEPPIVKYTKEIFEKRIIE